MAQEFSGCRMEYGKDAQGKEVLLKDGKFQVMMEWEKSYMIACIDALKPFGDVLEIGFGLGYSAERIQSYHPKSHTIVEFHPDVAKRAREWAKEHPGVVIVEDTWQSALPRLGLFDAIFFDDYPLESEQEMQKIQHESDASHALVKQGNKLLRDVEQKIPFLSEMKYSDEDLAFLMHEAPLHQPGIALQYARFLSELAGRGQITDVQRDRAIALLVKEKRVTREEMDAINKQTGKKEPFAFARTSDRFFRFLGECLAKHMRKGSRFSCFLSSPVSKFEDEKFVNEIITNPYLDFHEEEIVLEVPPQCDYFSGNKALVITITKMG